MEKEKKMTMLIWTNVISIGLTLSKFKMTFEGVKISKSHII